LSNTNITHRGWNRVLGEGNNFLFHWGIHRATLHVSTEALNIGGWFTKGGYLLLVCLWSLCCLSFFDLLHLITSLVSSSFSIKIILAIFIFMLFAKCVFRLPYPILSNLSSLCRLFALLLLQRTFRFQICVVPTKCDNNVLIIIILNEITTFRFIKWFSNSKFR
jgi:hypothetical protein